MDNNETNPPEGGPIAEVESLFQGGLHPMDRLAALEALTTQLLAFIGFHFPAHTAPTNAPPLPDPVPKAPVDPA